MGIRIPEIRPPFLWQQTRLVRRQSAAHHRKVGDRQAMEASSHPDRTPKPRIKQIDWQSVVRHADEVGPDSAVFVGEVDQSMRTHIRKGRFAYIDPSKYEVWTHAIEGSRTRARLYMRRKA